MPAAALEQAVRPFEHLPLYVQQLIESRPIKPDDATAYMRFGKAGAFATEKDLQEGFSVGVENPSVIIDWGDNDNKNKTKARPKTHTFTEIGRTVSEIKVVNPNNPNHFVFVERINEIVFKGPRLSTAATASTKTVSKFEPSWETIEEREANSPSTNYDYFRFVFKNKS